jgi:hypothetical protein
VHYDGAKAQNCIVQKICTMGGQSLLSLPGTSKKNFSFHFKHYNLTIRAVNFFETFYTCSPSSLVQDPTVESLKIEKIAFLLTELEMADLSIFLRKITFIFYGLNTHISLIRSPILEIFSAMESALHFLHIYHLDFHLKKSILPSNFEKILWSNKFLKVPPCRNYFQ